MHHVATQNANVRALFNVEIGEETAVAHVTRQSELVIRCDTQQNWSVALFVAVPHCLVDLSIERRDTHDRGRFAPDRVGVFNGQLLAMYFFGGGLMTKSRIEFQAPDRIRTQRFNLGGKSFVQSLNYRYHEHHCNYAD